MINQAPTLFIGIGGIGCQIAGAISDMISKEDRKYIGFIGIDTDVTDLSKRKQENHHIHYIQTSGDWDVQEFIDRHPEDDKWFPQDNTLRLRKMLTGAGQVRALSRLTFKAAEESGDLNLIFSEINRIRKVDERGTKRLVIVIVGSITGGTGAGMFIELPLFIRSKLMDECAVPECTIRGMFVGPDITSKFQNQDFLVENVCVNGYACIKELNAFYMHHMDQDDLPDAIANSIEIEHYDNTNKSPNNVPYNYLYLFEDSSKVGTIGDTHFEEVIKYISHIAFSLLFTPIVNGATSVEDNYILESIRNNMLNRYVGAGVCRMVYPIKSAQRYVTLSLVKDFVEREWLILDNRYKEEYRQAMERKNTDPNVAMPIRSESYVREFEKETYNNRAKRLLAKYTSDAFDLINNTYTSKADAFIKNIDKLVKDEVDRLWASMKSYVDLAHKRKSDDPLSIAEELFPSTREGMLSKKDSSFCIYTLLGTVHPIVARYFIYDLINKLEKNIKVYKKKYKDDLYEYDKDYDMISAGRRGAAGFSAD